MRIKITISEDVNDKNQYDILSEQFIVLKKCGRRTAKGIKPIIIDALKAKGLSNLEDW